MPPPPPPAPPPLPKLASGASSSQGKSNFEPPPDRNALLSQIRKGARLKKSETNDRSTPLIEGSRSPSNSSGAKRGTVETKSNGPFPVIPPGGLFAQGIPKLRPTVPKAGTQTQGENSAPSSLVIQTIKSGHSASFLDHYRIGQFGGSRSQPPSPVSKPRMSSAVSSNRTTDASESAGMPSGNPNFPDDVNIKGPAPAPPPASQKPVFKPSTEPPVGRPTVRRSASQTSLGQRPKLTRPPPNVKPPPPPKINTNVTPPQSAPPPPPSKPPNILRRQSFGVGESHASRFITNNKLSVPSNGTPKVVQKTIGPPPPPPRNNSAPNDLNKLNGSSSPGNHFKMNIAPPPPPNRAVATSNRAAPIRPPPPRAPAPPPPPPQHQFNSHHNQVKTSLSANVAPPPPPPPARVSSMKQTADFEERFKFHPAQTLPKPEKFPNTQKSYPSKVNLNRQKQSTRRQPPPPPPQAAGNPPAQQSKIHIQLNSGIFSNNFAHS